MPWKKIKQNIKQIVDKALKPSNRNPKPAITTLHKLLYLAHIEVQTEKINTKKQSDKTIKNYFSTLEKNLPKDCNEKLTNLKCAFATLGYKELGVDSYTSTLTEQPGIH